MKCKQVFGVYFGVIETEQKYDAGKMLCNLESQTSPRISGEVNERQSKFNDLSAFQLTVSEDSYFVDTSQFMDKQIDRFGDHDGLCLTLNSKGFSWLSCNQELPIICSSSCELLQRKLRSEVMPPSSFVAFLSASVCVVLVIGLFICAVNCFEKTKIDINLIEIDTKSRNANELQQRANKHRPSGIGLSEKIFSPIWAFERKQSIQGGNSISRSRPLKGMETSITPDSVILRPSAEKKSLIIEELAEMPSITKTTEDSPSEVLKPTNKKTVIEASVVGPTIASKNKKSFKILKPEEMRRFQKKVRRKERVEAKPESVDLEDNIGDAIFRSLEV